MGGIFANSQFPILHKNLTLYKEPIISIGLNSPGDWPQNSVTTRPNSMFNFMMSQIPQHLESGLPPQCRTTLSCLRSLEAAGFINNPIPTEHGYMDGRLAFARWRNPHQHDDPQILIHPVLRRKEWVGITDHQYSLMIPALVLATAILDDPVTLNYFHTLAMPADSMDNISHVSADLTADCKIMKIPDVLDYNQQWDTLKN
jgi:hypothetical protein